MKLSSILCPLNLLHCYIILAHPNLYPKTLAKREIERFSAETQHHNLHKRMEGSSRGMSTFPRSFLFIFIAILKKAEIGGIPFKICGSPSFDLEAGKLGLPAKI
jgi:hypothetical protein